MRIVRTVAALVALLAAMLGGTAAVLRADEGPNQCWRMPYEPQGACSVCGQNCMGAGYLCCTIVVG
jgi:hypothetical protein